MKGKDNSEFVDVYGEFSTEKACLAYLAKLRWPNGIRCPQCNALVTVERDETCSIHDTGADASSLLIYVCTNRGCELEFTTTTGTRFEDDKHEVRTWIFALALLCSAEEGVTDEELAEELQIDTESASRILRQLVDAMSIRLKP